MNDSNLHHLSDTNFKRLLGVSRPTFAAMLTIVDQPRSNRGRPPKLSAEEQLVLSLRYWRDYPALFKLGLAFGISETSAWRVVRGVEDQLIRSGLFSLPVTPSAEPSPEPVETVMDVTEITIERPKKTAAVV